MGHPWYPALREFQQELLPKLMEVGKTIGHKAKEGDELCLKIIGHYALLQKSFDPMTFTFLKEAFETYTAREKANEQEQTKDA